MPTRRAAPCRDGHSPGSRRKREGNCSLPLMTSSNNISEVRRGHTSCCRGGRLERADLTAGCRQLAMRSQTSKPLYCLIARAACVYTRCGWCPGWNTARILLYENVIFYSPPLLLSSSLSFSLLLSVSLFASTHLRITREMVSADSKGRPWRTPSLDRCVHLNWMSIRQDLICTRYIKSPAGALTTTDFLAKSKSIFFSECIE